MLAGVVGGAPGQADQAAEGGAVDDGAAPLPLHLEQLLLHEAPDAAQVDRLDLVVALLGLLDQGAHGAEDAGVVVGHVEAAELRHGAVHGGLR